MPFFMSEHLQRPINRIQRLMAAARIDSRGSRATGQRLSTELEKDWGHLIILGQAAATLQALQSRKSGQRLFLKRHLTVSKTLAPAFNQQRPAPLNRLPTISLQALSTTPDPTGSPRFRRRSQPIRSLLVL